MKILTSSSIGTFRDCPRRYCYKYKLHRVPAITELKLNFGRMFHEALKLFWLEGHDKASEYLTNPKHDIDEVERAKMCAMMVGCKRDPQYSPIVSCFEANFEIPIVNPDSGRSMQRWAFSGRTDGAVVDSERERFWVLEHKTTTQEITGYGAYWQRLSIDHQISFYCIARKVKGCVYEVYRKPSIKFCKKDADIAAYQARCYELIKEDPDKYYQSRLVEKTDDELNEERYDLWQQAHILKECDNLDRWPRNSGACRSFFGTCEYLEVCCGRARLEDDMAFRTVTMKGEGGELHGG